MVCAVKKWLCTHRPETITLVLLTCDFHLVPPLQDVLQGDGGFHVGDFHDEAFTCIFAKADCHRVFKVKLVLSPLRLCYLRRRQWWPDRWDTRANQSHMLRWHKRLWSIAQTDTLRLLCQRIDFANIRG